MVLVDSSIWVEALRSSGSPAVKRKLAELLEEGELCVCGIIRLEILGAARKSERKALDSYFAAIPSLPIGKRSWEEAIALSRAARDRGLTVPWNDIVIAALALHHALPLYCCDQHFESLAEQERLVLYV